MARDKDDFLLKRLREGISPTYVELISSECGSILLAVNQTLDAFGSVDAASSVQKDLQQQRLE